MSLPSKPLPVKLFSSVIFSSASDIDGVLERLVKNFGEISYRSDHMVFDQTGYYREEMGDDLSRVFVGFERLVDRDGLASIKHLTNSIERDYASGGLRAVNVDPGFITLENVVLATGKNFSHRIYLKDGIYAEVTLIYKGGAYTPLEWTYPDYATDKIIEILTKMREEYRETIKRMRG